MHVKIYIEKMSKNVRKLRILASQNPPKIHPKYLQNRRPKKHGIFQRFLFEKAFVARAPTLDFCWQGHSFVSFSQNSVLRFWNAFWVRKTSQKPSRNDVRTLPKSMPKTCCFSTSIFSGFGLDFGASWASNLEPSWPKNGKNH